MCLRWHHFGIAWLLAWAGESASVLDMMTQTEPGSAWRNPSTGHNCPPGASFSVQFGGHGGCFCNFGFSGLLRWDPSGGRYRGACTQTPCPGGTVPGVLLSPAQHRSHRLEASREQRLGRRKELYWYTRCRILPWRMCPFALSRWLFSGVGLARSRRAAAEMQLPFWSGWRVYLAAER